MSSELGQFKPGNQLGNRPRQVEAMIRSVLALDDRGKLRTAIERCLDQAAEGSLPHLDWLTTRIDGKPKGDDAQDKSQLIQVVINGYRDERIAIVQGQPIELEGANDTILALEGGAGTTGGALSDTGAASREPVDSPPVSEISDISPEK